MRRSATIDGVRPIRAFAVVVVTAAATLVASASPASAHDLGGRQPTDIRARVLRVEPAIDGVAVHVVDLGTRLELRNRTRHDVVVLGYDDEPYLRVGPAGVFENTKSPANFLNRTLNPTQRVPSSYDATAPPTWQRISAGQTVRWHDHRAHATRANVADGPMEWRIPMRVDGRDVAVLGESELVHVGAWWAWFVVSAAIASLISLAARRAWRATVVVVLLAMLAAGILHLVAGWTSAANSVPARLGAIVIPVIGLGLGVVAIVRAATRSPEAAAPWVLLAGVVLFIGLGLGDVLDLVRSQLPSSLPANVVRVLVTLQLGGGVGLAIAGATQLRPAEATKLPRPSPTTASVPTSE
jgi:hypothetical protein